MKRSRSGRGALRPALLATAAAAAMCGLLSVLLPGLMTAGHEERSLKKLRSQAAAIQREFAALARAAERKLDALTLPAFPSAPELQFAKLKDLALDLDVEGAAVYGTDRRLRLWLGRVLNLEDMFFGPSPALTPSARPKMILVREKASDVLALIHQTETQEIVAVYRLLAFNPEWQSSHLREYSFLPTRLRLGVRISFWDFRENISVFERFFALNKDEHLGRPGRSGEVRNLTFPLRTQEGRLLAHVSLSSRTRAATRLAARESLLFAACLAAAAALLLLMVFIVRRPAFREKRRGTALALLAVLAALRILCLPLSRLGPARNSRLFSPAQAGFISLDRLTSSPADIFLTCLLGFALAVLIALFSFPKTAGERTSGLPSRGRRAAAGLLFAAGPVLFDGSRAFLSRLVAHANLNLFRFDFSPAFLLLQTGLFFVLAGTVLLLAVAFRAGSRAFRSAFPPAVIAALSTAAVVFLRRDRAWAIVLLQILVAALFLLWASGRPALRRAAAGALIPVLALFVYAEMERATRSKTRALAEGILKETVLSHAHSIEALLAESLDDLDAEDREIRAFLRRSETTSEAARRIWERTAAAKLNAYSGLQFFDADGAEAARFVLNVPKISSETESLPNRADWTIVRIAKPFMGKAREFLAGYRDWTDDGGELGRTVFYVSLDYDTLPFLYSANPYFELLRTNPLPSIEPFDIGFAVFDEQGRILFNPARLTTGLPPAVVEAAETSGTGLWSKFADNNRTYDLFSFRTENRIAAFLAPRKGFFGRSADLLKVSLLLAAFGLLTALFRPRGTRPEDRKHPLWSFSSRVYVSFIAVALAPLLLLAFVSRPFFNRLLTRQFVEKATIHANMARNAMDDFVYLQEERRALVDSQPEDLALFLSTSISNDVNLFMEGRLVSSSRREYFDAGLLPDLLDGEIYYKLRFANDPFTAQTRRLGGFSYQVLTVPYTSLDPPLLISLPFPFERQEIGEATRSLVDLLLVLSVFFVGLVALLARAIGVMIVTPIRRLLGGTKAVALGNLEFEVDYERRDEMKTLIDGFNGMIRSLKDHQRELADLGKKAAWAEMARKIAHEIKNPLTPIQLSAEHLLRVYEDQGADFETALRESTAYIIGEVENLRRIAQEFLELSKTAVLRRETFDLGAFIREIVEPYRKLLGGRIAFREAYDAEGRVSADKAKLKIAFRNIVINAVEAIRGRGEVRVTVSGSGDRVVTSFEDTGPGIEKEILDRIFEPYFSTKDVGTGLGLPIARKIVEDHDGSIRLESEAGRGTRVTIALPRSEG